MDFYLGLCLLFGDEDLCLCKISIGDGLTTVLCFGAGDGFGTGLYFSNGDDVVSGFFG